MAEYAPTERGGYTAPAPAGKHTLSVLPVTGAGSANVGGARPFEQRGMTPRSIHCLTGRAAECKSGASGMTSDPGCGRGEALPVMIFMPWRVLEDTWGS